MCAAGVGDTDIPDLYFYSRVMSFSFTRFAFAPINYAYGRVDQPGPNRLDLATVPVEIH